MNLSQKERPSPTPPVRRRSLGQRLFARFGTPVILVAVLLVVVAWTGFLCWVLIGLFDRLIH